MLKVKFIVTSPNFKDLLVSISGAATTFFREEIIYFKRNEQILSSMV